MEERGVEGRINLYNIFFFPFFPPSLAENNNRLPQSSIKLSSLIMSQDQAVIPVSHSLWLPQSFNL